MSLSRRETIGLVMIGLAMIIAFVVIWLATPPAHAQEVVYTSDDVHAAIWQYAMEQDVSYRWLRSIVACETGYTFDPYSVGRRGELGAAQLAPWGELKTFYRWGYDDPFSPYQSVRFLAQRLAMGGARAWSCA